MAEGGYGCTDTETGSVPIPISLYSRHSQVNQRLKAFPDKAVCTVVTLRYIRDWKRFQTHQSVQSSLSGKLETGSVPRPISLYSRHSQVNQRLDALPDPSVCTVVTLR
ncbi:hypothetical protein DPMN_147931 [Dreissena polymorpha]|uniref:Uncharacterized protein n=1 Tax=Dreissena polymorpha TaxID=45954 RepID=A0A9D4FBI1_DREPO|nr:hypothetical protein DPMN_147931 [Dreissena polymorpha]